MFCKKFVVVFSLILLMSLSLSANAAPKKIVFTNNQWDSQLFHNELAKFIVENAFEGYKVELSTGSSNLNWHGLVNGDIDLDIESWTDVVATYPEDVARGDIIPLGVLVPDSSQGLYVPRYVIEGDKARGIKPLAPDLKTVEDLKKYAKIFKDPEVPSKGRLYGAIPGWMIDTVLHKKFLHFGLDKEYNYFRAGSEAVLFASLGSAYNLGEPWVGYCFEPTWVTGKLDLIKLEDVPYDKALYDKGACEIPNQELKIVCSRNFPKRAPELLDFFKKYKTGSERVSKALAYIQDTKASHAKTAIWFLREYDSLLDEWLTAEQAGKVRSALAKQKL